MRITTTTPLTRKTLERLVDITPTFSVPRRFHAKVTGGKDLPYDLTMEIVYGDEGRFVCESMTVERRQSGPPVEATGLRAIPMARIISEAVRQMAIKKAGRSIDELERVAFTYRIAYVCGERPTQAVMDRFSLSRAAASRRVAAAREKGLLGPALDRRAGEKGGQ